MADDRVKELEEENAVLKAENERLSSWGVPEGHSVCLNCGAKAPCDLNDNDDGRHGDTWPGSPCTFDTYTGLLSAYKRICAENEALRVKLRGEEPPK